MRKTRVLTWLAFGVTWAIFCVWYTDFSGPLTDREVKIALTKLREMGSSAEQLHVIETFARSDTGRQFLMLNAIEINENPTLLVGTVGESGSVLMRKYMQHMLPALIARASHPVVVGDAVSPAIDVVGIDNAESWGQGALFRYRSRRDFLEIVSHPKFLDKHSFKTAALKKTIAYPIEPRLYLGDLRLIFGLVVLACAALMDSWRLSRIAAVNSKTKLNPGSRR